MKTRLTTLLALFSAFALSACEDPSGKKPDCSEDAPRSVQIDEGEDFGENPFASAFESDETCEPALGRSDRDDSDTDLDGETDEDLTDGFDDDWSDDDSAEYYDYDEYWY